MTFCHDSYFQEVTLERLHNITWRSLQSPCLICKVYPVWVSSPKDSPIPLRVLSPSPSCQLVLCILGDLPVHAATGVVGLRVAQR